MARDFVQASSLPNSHIDESPAMVNHLQIISVESRKGGVGKTTAALNLARTLLTQQEGVAVLLLDLDITGTDVTYGLHSPFWKPVTHIVRLHGGDNEDNVSPANLFGLFDKRFMRGEEVPKFSEEPAPSDRLSLMCNLLRVNVLGSHISQPNGNHARGIDQWLCHPSVLFDELHAYWLIDFVKKVVANFVEIARHENGDRPVAVVLDNSPGYVGIAPAVQDWLTDLGPETGKFLMITSLDSQDGLSAAYAVQSLNSMYQRKWDISRLYHRAASDDQMQVNLEESDRAFFLRLAETSPDGVGENALQPSHERRDNDLAFYHRPVDEIGRAFLQDASRFQAVLLNRVPRELRDTRPDATPDRLFELPQELTVFRDLLGKSSAACVKKMVPYDPFIEHQFALISKAEGSSGRTTAMPTVIKKAISRVRDHIEGPLARRARRLLARPSPLEFEDLHTIRRSVLKASHDLESLATDLKSAGLTSLAALIPDEWLHGMVALRVGFLLSDVIKALGMPHHAEAVSLDVRGNAANPQAQEFLERMTHLRIRWMRRFHLDVPRTLADHLWPSLHTVLVMSLTSPLWHEPFSEAVSAIACLVNGIQCQHWIAKDLPAANKALSLPEFLAQDRADEEDLQRASVMPALAKAFPRSEVPPLLFCELYRNCCAAQARLLDLYEDTGFLLSAIASITDVRLESSVLPMVVRDLVQDVLINKTLAHAKAMDQIARESTDLVCMRDFTNVLTLITRKWGGVA